ncbi:hypothetical protein [Spirosoma utsteinense]|uniref:hypothetical protein n=1 Tax=Spirosoma utsteinense TaxID=2585773 RepID=UPI001648B5C4|nr:hypothetical protein [Spirosoma utsteinense]MBC3785747.1 hypothetical protein [Spirosoma utsteinense]
MLGKTVPEPFDGLSDPGRQDELRLHMAKEYRRMMQRISDPHCLKDQTRLIAADAIIQQAELKFPNATADYHAN